MNKITTKSTFKSWMETINNLIDSLSSKLGVSDNAVSATKAEQDSLGNVITDTYVTKEKVSDLPVIKENIDELASLEDGLYWVKNSSVDYDVFGRLPLGHIFTWPFSTPPDGSIIANGSEYSRELYSDLWNYVNQHLDWIKTEEEWQQIASSNNGYCSYYSTGDGTTTFRTPKFAPYQQLAITSSNAGLYHEAGLPNISDSLQFRTINNPSATVKNIVDTYPKVDSSHNGSFSFEFGSGSTWSAALNYTGGINNKCDILHFDASRSSDRYGKSNTVQPESSEWIVCIVAYGKVTNVGNTDVANVMSAINNISSNPNLQGVTHIVDYWTDNVTGGYILYSNGYCEQYGRSYFDTNTVITLYKPYKDAYYNIVTSCISSDTFTKSINIHSIQNNSFSGNPATDGSTISHLACCWKTFGYVS